jgi:hypothetical protein
MIPVVGPLETIGRMKRLGEILTPYSFPIKSAIDEEEITVLKQREMMLDGYRLVVYFSAARYGTYKLETVQLFARCATFLPFYVVCKVAGLFLGCDHLNLVELIHHKNGVDETSRKVYVWSVYRDETGQAISNPYMSGKVRNFEGLSYSVLGPEQIVLY